MNFLLQIRGTKTAQLWDPADESVMTDVVFTDIVDAGVVQVSRNFRPSPVRA